MMHGTINVEYFVFDLLVHYLITIGEYGIQNPPRNTNTIHLICAEWRYRIYN